MKLVAALVVALCASALFVHADGEAPATTKTPPAGPTPPPATPKSTEGTLQCADKITAMDGKDDDAMPGLQERFQTTIEAKFLKGPDKEGATFKPFVVKVREYTDNVINHRRAVFQTVGSTEKHILYDLKTRNAFAFTVDTTKDQCSGTPDRTDLYFKFSLDKNKKTGTMMGLEDIYNFTASHPIKLTNDSVQIRDIESEKWSTCLNWAKYDDNDFVIDWYWAKTSVKMPNTFKLSAVRVPLRLEAKGYTKDKSGDEDELKYHHIYDFLNYDELQDDTVLWPEMEMCGEHNYFESNTASKFPTITDSFSVELEQINGQTVTYGKYVMDTENKLMRTDLQIIASDNSYYKTKCGLGMCKVIHDFDVGLEYIIKQDGNCGVYSIPVKKSDVGNLPNDIVPDPGENRTAYVTMANARQLFRIASGVQLEYQDQRIFRDVLAEAWVARDTANSDDTYRGFYMKDKKLWGYIYNSKANDGKVTSYKTNFYNHDDTTHDLSAFDIHYCFADSKKDDFKTIHARCNLKEKWDDVMNMTLAKVQQKLRKKLVGLSGVNALRITDMMISQDDDDDVAVWFTILWASPISGSVYHEKTPSPQKDTKQARDDLKKVLKDDVEVTIDGDKKVTIEGDSLKTDDDTMKGDPRPSQTVVKTGHSSGQMATLGICMLILGAVVGIGVGFYLWRRRGRGVPYQIHH